MNTKTSRPPADMSRVEVGSKRQAIAALDALTKAADEAFESLDRNMHVAKGKGTQTHPAINAMREKMAEFRGVMNASLFPPVQTANENAAPTDD